MYFCKNFIAKNYIFYQITSWKPLVCGHPVYDLCIFSCDGFLRRHNEPKHLFSLSSTNLERTLRIGDYFLADVSSIIS